MTNAPQQPEVVDDHRAAAIVGLSRATLATLRSRGGGPPFARIGRAVRYRIADLRAWVDARMVVSTADTSDAERKSAPPPRRRRTPPEGQ